MKKNYFLMFAFLIATNVSTLHAGSPQVISGAGSTTLNSSGTKDGVSFANQNVNESTLIVPRKSIINKHKNTVGIITNANGLGNISFTGNKGTTKVYGNVGNANYFMDQITITGPKVKFSGNVHAESLLFSSSGAQAKFKGNATFGTNGVSIGTLNTLIVEEGKTLNGNVSGNAGYVVINNASTVNGNLDIFTLEFQNDGPGLSEGATVNGNVNTNSINTRAGTVQINGNLSFFGDKNTIWLLASNSVAEPIIVSGSVTFDGPITVVYHVPYLHAPRVGAYNIVTALGGGTSGQTVNVIMNDPRFISVGSNENGNITVTSTPRNSP